MRYLFLAAVLASLGCQQGAPSSSAAEPVPAPVVIDVMNEEASPEPTPPRDELVRGGTPVAVADALSGAFAWSARSADGSVEVRQVPVGKGQGPARCTTSSTVSPPNGEPPRIMWKWETCLATREQLKFVSPDGQRVLVLDPLPVAVAVGEKGRDAEVVTLYEQGLRVKFLRAGSAVEALDARRWVKGLAGHPGAPPAYSADGTAITFESLEGRAFELGFDGRGFASADEDVRAFLSSEGLYRYQDERGTTQVVDSVDRIPERYRGRARSVKAQVAVQSASKPPAAPVTAPASPPVPGGDLPQGPPLKSPAELVNEARETAEKVREIRREQERVLDSLH